MLLQKIIKKILIIFITFILQARNIVEVKDKPEVEIPQVTIEEVTNVEIKEDEKESTKIEEDKDKKTEVNKNKEDKKKVAPEEYIKTLPKGTYGVLYAPEVDVKCKLYDAYAEPDKILYYHNTLIEGLYYNFEHISYVEDDVKIPIANEITHHATKDFIPIAEKSKIGDKIYILNNNSIKVYIIEDIQVYGYNFNDGRLYDSSGEWVNEGYEGIIIVTCKNTSGSREYGIKCKLIKEI